MTASIDYLPVWKQNATPEERFLELAMIAKKHPERFSKMVVLYQEHMPNGNVRLRKFSDGAELSQVLGLLAEATYDYLRESRTAAE